MAALIASIASLAGSIAWPIVACYCIWRIGPTLRPFLAELSKASFKGFGFEASAESKAIATAALASAQIAHERAEAVSDLPSATDVYAKLSSSLSKASYTLSSPGLRSLAGKKIAWVDDHPENNEWEMSVLIALGAYVVPERDTNSALRHLRRSKRSFDLIISDMTRDGNKMAGYELLSEMKQMGVEIPLIFYAGSSSSEQQAIAIERGAFGRASDPEHLILLIGDALQ